MTVFVDGVELYSWPVSTGMRGYSTPSGTYTASSMNKIWYSKQWDNAPMPNAVFFTKEGHAIHGTLDEKNLGKPASHGCVRLSRQNAATLYALVEANGLPQTQVVLTGVTAGGEGPKVASPGRWPGLRLRRSAMVRTGLRLSAEEKEEARHIRKVVRPLRTARLLRAPTRPLLPAARRPPLLTG